MKIPLWLRSRPIYDSDPIIIKKLFPGTHNPHFTDITIDAIKHYYFQNKRPLFYNLIRILGFYGVVFTGKLSTFSGPCEKNPEVILVHPSHANNKISKYLEDPNISAFLSNFEIRFIKQLHGIPVSNIQKLIKYDLAIEVILSLLPVSIKKVDNNFFYSHPDFISQQNENETHSDIHDNSIDIYLSKPIEELNLSNRTYNCMKKNDINLLGDILKKDAEYYIKLRGLGKKSILEIAKIFFSFLLKFSKRERNTNNGDSSNDYSLVDSIEVLKLSNSSSSMLYRNNILKFSEVLKLSENELLTTPGLDKEIMNEIKEKLMYLFLNLPFDKISIKSGNQCSLNNFPDDSLEKLNIPINVLSTSTRIRNFLYDKQIEYVWQLVGFSNEELFNEKNIGLKSIREINSIVHGLGFRFGMKFSQDELFNIKTYSQNSNKIISGYQQSINIASKSILEKLNKPISELILSVRTKNILTRRNIEFVWQLIQLSEADLLSEKNFGRKSLKELKKKISDLDLRFGISFKDDEILKITSYEYVLENTFYRNWLKDTAKTMLSRPLSFLKEQEKKVLWDRIWKVGKVRTLEEIAQEMGLSRERVRQIEKKTFTKIRSRFGNELAEVLKFIKKQVDKMGGIACVQDIDIDLENISPQERSIIDCLLNLKKQKVLIDWEYSLILNDGYGLMKKIFDKIEDEIRSKNENNIFSSDDLENVMDRVLKEHKINTTNSFSTLLDRLCFDKNIKKINELLTFGRIRKIDRVALAFKKYFPKGLHIYKKQEKFLRCLQEFEGENFSGFSVRGILGHVTNHPQILMWGRGFFIHEENVKYNADILDTISKWILSFFDRGHSRFQIAIPYEKFKTELVECGIPNTYALYTLLRQLDNPRIGLKKYPTIIDVEADEDLSEGVIQELENYLYQKGKEVSYTELKEEFIIKRGWKDYSLNHDLTINSDEIYPWNNNSYIHRDFIKIDYQALEKFTDAIREKLSQIQGVYSLKGAKVELGIKWEQACPNSSVRTMIKLIRSIDAEDLQIERYFIKLAEHSGSISAHAELEEYILECGDEVAKYDLQQEFNSNRGWTYNQLYSAIRDSQLFKSGKNTYIHPTTIKWNEALGNQIHLILKKYLDQRNQNGIPHMQIDELIYEYILPDLPLGIQWNRQLIKSVGEKLGDFIFFDDAYILTDNDFDIEDLDDIIGFLLAKNFRFGITNRKKLEELLWREGILENGHSIPANQFFQESSIKFIEASDEICLSHIGKEKYGRAT